MNSSFFAKFVTIISFLLSLSYQALSQKIDSRLAAEILKKIEYDWLIAEFKLDTATISKMMDDSFISINPSGILNKQEELDGIYKNISQRINNDHVVDSLYLDDVHIRFYEATAVVSFVSVTKGRIKDIPFTNRRTRFYDVWIYRNNSWKAVSSQGTPLR
ncbi:MAG: nuclear transport factor 2 family protein [Ferruginibacter sp.]